MRISSRTKKPGARSTGLFCSLGFFKDNLARKLRKRLFLLLIISIESFVYEKIRFGR